MVKDPEVGFMQATYWQLCTSFSVSFCLSYLRGESSAGVPPQPRLTPAVPPLRQKRKKPPSSQPCPAPLLAVAPPTAAPPTTAPPPAALLPVPVVHVLPDEGVRGHGPVLVHLGHVHVVDEVDQLLRARRPVVSPRFLLQRLLQDP